MKTRPQTTIVAALSLFFVAQLAFIAWSRIRFPYDVEWMEGGLLMQAQRIFRGDTPYPAPSATFVPFLYPPLYPWLLAKLAFFTGGLGYALGRSLSLAATVVTAGLSSVVVFRSTRRPELAVLAVGLEAALAGFGGSFLDLVRPDALAMALVMIGAVLAVRGGRARLVLAGIALAAACFTKQTSLVVGLGVIAGVALTRDRRSVAVLVTVAALAGSAGFAGLEISTHRQFSFYVLGLHQSHEFHRDNFVFYAHRDILHLAPLVLVLPAVWLHRIKPYSLVPLAIAMHLGVAVIQRAFVSSDLPHMYYRDLWYPRVLWCVPPIAIAVLLLVGTRTKTDEAPVSPTLRYWGAVFLGAFFAAVFGHSTQWAFKNSLLPLATLGVPFLILLVDAIELRWPASQRWLVAAIFLQLVALYEPTSLEAPTSDDRVAWDRLRTRLEAVSKANGDGKIMVLGHPRLAWELTETQHLHGMGISDLAASGGVPDLEPRLAAHEWAAIVTDDSDWVQAPPVIGLHYLPVESLESAPMKTGSRCKPAMLWLPSVK